MTIVNWKFIFVLYIFLISWIFVSYFFILKISLSPNCPLLIEPKVHLVENRLNLSPPVQIVNASEPINASFNCIKTKKLLHYINTTICTHEPANDIYISAVYQDPDSIWEEGGVTRILRLLLRHPHLDFIDIGANIGTYTMYAAALGRFVLAVDCFGPNIDRLHRAIQLANVVNRVVLVQNAIYSHSGELLRLSSNSTNIGGQEIEVPTNQNITNDLYTVKTIQLDDLYPILVSRNIRGAIMKVDIEGSEHFIAQGGNRIFDSFDIPLVQIEWMKIREYPDRAEILIDFFTKRNYEPRSNFCRSLNLPLYSYWPNDVFWKKTNATIFC